MLRLFSEESRSVLNISVAFNLQDDFLFCFKLLFIETLFPLLWDDNLVEHLKVIQHFSFATNFGRIYRCKMIYS